MTVSELRKILGMTQEEFAREVKVSLRAVQLWETGKKPSKLAQASIDRLAKKHKKEA
jgi:DNA-binding transcriptional regulator YiaG